MVAAPTFMLRTATDSGGLNQYLPDFTGIDMSPIYCDAGTLVFSYPNTGINFNLLTEGLEVAVLMNGSELTELRSVIETIEGDDADDAEKGALWKFTCRTFAGLLDYCIVYPINWVPGQILKTAKPQTYSAKTPGAIFNNLLVKAQARGCLPGFTWGFNDTHDSEGNPWSNQMDLSLDVGTTYLSVLQDMASAAMAEFKVNARVIRLYDVDVDGIGKMGVDRSVGETPVRFIKGRDLQQSPRKIDTRGLVSTALVAGANNLVFLETTNGPSTDVYGRREGYYSAGNVPYVSIPGFSSLLEIVSKNWLNNTDKPALEVTHGLHFETEDNPRPITDFDTGDWALSDSGQGLERFRILQWVMSVSADGTVTGSITMNFLFNSQLSQVNSALNALTNGSANAGSAAKNDGIAPATVSGINLASSSYLVNSTARALLTVTWPPVTTNEDGSGIEDLDYYMVRWRYTGDTAWRGNLRIESDQTVALFQNLDCNAGVQVQVRAADIWGNSSPFSATAAAITAGDSIAPLKPASPVLSSNVGTFRVVWSGLDSSGNPQPADLAGVEVHLSTADFTPTSATKVDTLPPGVVTTTITQGLTYGTEYWVKLIAVDTSGNRSPASDTTSTSHTVLKQVVSVEIGTGQVGLANTAFSDVGNLIDDGSFELVDYRTSRTALFAGTHLAFDSSSSSNGSWSLRSDSFAAGTTEYFTLQDSLPVKPGERIFGALDLKATATATGTVNLDITWFNAAGVQIDANGNPIANFYTLGGIGNTLKDGAWHLRVTGTSQVAPPGVATMRLIAYTNGRTAGTVWIDAIEVRRQIDTLLIQDAAITTAQIANLAVNDAKISDLNVGKITAGTLGADIIVGARIKTANTGARTEMSAAGFGAWDSSNTQTFSGSSADGSIVIIGSLKSGGAGNRVEINPANAGLPEIRFYPSTGSNYAFINAFSPSGSGSAFLGLNSGQTTLNGQTSVFRVFMTDNQASFQTIVASTQAALGAHVSLFETQATLGYTTATGADSGFITVSDTGTQVGFNGTSDSTDNWWYFNNDGTVGLIGRFLNNPSQGHNEGIFAVDDSITSAFGGSSYSYAVTMISTPRPFSSIYYTGASQIFSWISARSTTGFTISWNIAANLTIQGITFRM